MPIRNTSGSGLTGVAGDGFQSPNGQSQTKTHISTNIWIFANKGSGNPVPVGAITSINWTENRPLKPIDELGTDGHIDSVPTASCTYDGQVQRTRWNGRRIFEAFGRSFLHVKSMRVPFDIVVYDVMRGTDQIIVTTLQNVWFKSLTTKYQSNDWIITDDASFMCEDISSILQSTNGSAIYSPENVYYNPLEVSADIGAYRGAMDAPGILSAFNGSAAPNF
jgi:hypothetical protein